MNSLPGTPRPATPFRTVLKAQNKLPARPARRHSFSGGAFESVLSKELLNLARSEPRTVVTPGQSDDGSNSDTLVEVSLEMEKAPLPRVDLARTPRPANAARPPTDENTAARPTKPHGGRGDDSQAPSEIIQRSVSNSGAATYTRPPPKVVAIQPSLGPGYPPRGFGGAGAGGVAYPYGFQHPGQSYPYPPCSSPQALDFSIYYDQPPYAGHSRFPSFEHSPSPPYQTPYSPSDYAYDSSNCPSPWTQQGAFSPAPSAPFESPYPFYGRTATPPTPPEMHHFVDHHMGDVRRQSFEFHPSQVMGHPMPWVGSPTSAGCHPTRTLTMEQLESGAIMRRMGTAKFFDVQKGFGFILDDRIAEIGNRDIFVHYTALLMKSGFRCLSTNEAVEYDLVKATGGGYQALNVCGARGNPLRGLTDAQGALQSRGSSERGTPRERPGKSHRKNSSSSSSTSHASPSRMPKAATTMLESTIKSSASAAPVGKIQVRIPSPTKKAGAPIRAPSKKAGHIRD